MAEIKLDIDSNARSVSSDMKGLSSSIKAVAAGFVAVTGAVAGLGAAIATVSVNAARNQRELENMARLAGISAEEFEKLAFATEQFGINGEQLSDISKDVTEKLGEFSRVGTGAFTDFMDVLGISEDSAKSLAKELSNMPAPQALLEITKQLESGGASRAQISFVLESLGSDLTKLIPLLENGGEAWKELSNEFARSTSRFNLTKEMSSDLRELATEFGLVESTANKAVTFFSAQFAPAITSTLESIRDLMGQDGATSAIKNATVSIVEFGVFALDVLGPVVSVVQTLLDGLNKIGTAISVVVSGVSGFGGALLAGADVGQAADIAAEIENEARDRGIRREQAIQDIGGGVGSGIDQLTQTLLSLKASIDRGNAQQEQTSIQTTKISQNNRSALQAQGL